ncbi:hypothetical protein LPP1_g37 [Leptolyngbya phage LPP-1]|uniref:Uncharacterized protein n=1 Tax=Leptolyngbya phage LPP-1 TaxID=2996049 RepID=A0AAE9PUD9_9CAUD|nr:hypothetical protein LPP1_g37 [Leptolyngbya phage LPP-1]
MNANSVTKEQLEKLLDSAVTESWVVWGKEMHISYMLESGFTVTGRSACVDPANFDVELGKKYCRENAIEQLWALEGYRLQWQLYEDGVLPKYGGYEPLQVGGRP